MAEVAAVGSIVGIASFGIQLTQALYEFGSNVSSAREQTGYIARHVDLYSNVLDILSDRIDAEDPILSGAALDLIDELKFQSEEIFTKIEKSLPNPKEGKDDISFLQKVKWNFTKNKVALLVGELDYLRSTVHLLVTIIFTGRQIRSRRKPKPKPNDSDSDQVDLELRKQGLKAQNALLAHHEATEKLPSLQQQVEHPEDSDSTDNDASQRTVRVQIQRTDIICMRTTALSDLQQSLAPHTDPTERQRVVLQRSPMVLQQLLQQWTTVDLRAPEAHLGEFDADFKADAAEKPKPEPSNSKDGSTKYMPTTSLPNRNRKAESEVGIGGKALPDGWHERYDTSSDRIYYCNPRTTESQWEFPGLGSRKHASDRDRGSGQERSIRYGSDSRSPGRYRRNGDSRSAANSKSDDAMTGAKTEEHRAQQADRGRGSNAPIAAAGLAASALAGLMERERAKEETARFERSAQAQRKQDPRSQPDSKIYVSQDAKSAASNHESASERRGTPYTTVSEEPPAKRQSTPYASMAGERTGVNEENSPITPISASEKQSAPPSQTSANGPLYAEDLFARSFHGAHQAHQTGTQQTSKSSSGSDPKVTCRSCSGKGYERSLISTKCTGCNGSGKAKRRGSPACPDCYGRGYIGTKDVCSKCKGKKEVPSDSYRYEDRLFSLIGVDFRDRETGKD